MRSSFFLFILLALLPLHSGPGPKNINRSISSQDFYSEDILDSSFKNNLHIMEHLRIRYGLRYGRDEVPRENLTLLKELDVVQSIHSHNLSFLYFKNFRKGGSDRWKVPLFLKDLKNYPVHEGSESIDLVESIKTMEAVEMIVTKDHDKILVHGRIQPNSEQMTYLAQMMKERPDADMIVMVKQ